MKTERIGGYLAVYPVLYEPDMGVEHAQYPSKEYMDTYRTDVLYYAISRDGERFSALNNNKAVMSPKGCRQLGSPTLFRRMDGGYCLLATVNNDSSEVMFFDSEDLLYYSDGRKVSINDMGIAVKDPTVKAEDGEYRIYWEGGDGRSYVSASKDLMEFSAPVVTEYEKTAEDASLPEYANAAEASVFPLTADEYDRVIKKYGRLYSVGVSVPDVSVKLGEKIALPRKVSVKYSDDSETPMNVRWDTSELDIDALPAGEYVINGKIASTADYNSPLAECRADPYAVYDEENGVYYFTASNMNERSAAGGGAYENIIIRRAKNINDITDAEEFVIWRDSTLPDGTKVTGMYWAPEIHKMGSKWRVIALATVTEPGKDRGEWKQCIFTCNCDDLTDADAWEYTGYIHDATNGESVGAFDTTYFEHKGKSYYVTPKAACIWITTVDPENPLYPTSPLVKISSADRAFETNIGPGKAGWGNVKGLVGQAIQEASSVLVHGDRIFVVYAGCTIDMMYCVCVLHAHVDADLLDPDSWHKYPYPILATQDLTKTVKKADYTKVDGTTNVTGHGDHGLLPEAVGEYEGMFGPGHNSFTVDESGNPVIIYHARDWSDSYPGAVGSEKYGLSDPGRHAYAGPVIFNYEGFPVCCLTPEEYLAEDLRSIKLTINVTE